jgi:hypothetical protein
MARRAQRSTGGGGRNTGANSGAVVQNQPPAQPVSNTAPPPAPGSGQQLDPSSPQPTVQQVGAEAMPPQQTGGVTEDAQPPAQRTRIPLGTHTQKLELPRREGFHRHWFNDRPGRIQQAQAAGYTFVKDDEGKPISRTVGVRDGGGGLLAYAMEIPKPFYDEDFAAGQERVDKIDAEIRGGKVESKPGDGRYVPKDGIRITSSHNEDK